VTESGRVYRLQRDLDEGIGRLIASAFARDHRMAETDFESVSIADVVLTLERTPTKGMN
jgi:hypothetical protein